MTKIAAGAPCAAVWRSIQRAASASLTPSRKKTSADPALTDNPSRTSSESISAAERTGTSRPRGASTSRTSVASRANTS